jgi:hypothetical protein
MLRSHARIRPMSDKTKMLADQALTRKRMIEWYRREQVKPKFDPRCRCGEPGPWAVHRWPGVEFYCEKHLPEWWR